MSNAPVDQPPPIPPIQAKKKNNSGCWIAGLVFIAIIGFLIVSAIISAFSSIDLSLGDLSVKETTYQESVVEEGSSGNKILIIDVDGVISSGDGSSESMVLRIRKQLREVRQSPHVLGVLLKINSPGGGVTASDQIYEEVMKTKAAGKKIVVFMDEVAASGGYYIACGADQVLATPTTITGSIGVIISSVNVTGLMDKIGVKSQVFKSGDFKDTLSMAREMREDEKRFVQDLVDESYQRFISLVSKGRGISIETLRERKLIDGRILSGVKAQELGLIDQVGYWDDAVTAVRALVGDPDAALVKAVPDQGLLDMLPLLGIKTQGDTLKLTLDQPYGFKLKPNVPYVILPAYAR